MTGYREDNTGIAYSERSNLICEESGSKRSRKRRPKDASKSRKAVVLAACLLLQMVSNGIGFGLGVMYVEVMEAFDAPSSTTALIQSLFMSITTAGGILWSPVLRRYGSGTCSFVGAITSCVGFFASSFSTSVYMIIALTGVVASFGMCVCYLAPFIVASLLFREDAGVALVFLTTGSSLGQFIFPNLYELFISQYGWSGAFVLISGLAMQCVPASVIIYGSQDFMLDVSGGDEDENGNKKAGCNACNLDWSLLTQGVFIVVLFNCFLLSGTGNLEGWFLVDMMTLKGYERETGSLFVSLLGLLNFFGRLTGVVLRLKVRVPTMYHWVYISPMMGILHFLVIQLTSYWSLLISCVLYGYVFGLTVALAPAIMLEIAGHEGYADGMTFVNVCYGIGDLFGGTLGGIVKDSYGDYNPMFYLAIAASIYLAITTCALMVMIRRKSKGNHSNRSYEQLKGGDE